jgi:hypothetical protein
MKKLTGKLENSKKNKKKRKRSEKGRIAIVSTGFMGEFSITKVCCGSVMTW